MLRDLENTTMVIETRNERREVMIDTRKILVSTIIRMPDRRGKIHWKVRFLFAEAVTLAR
jgi:hypothetical protein